MHIWQDIRYGTRVLIKSPGFAATAILTLTLGIGGTATVFTIVNSVLLEPLPLANPDELVMVWETEPTETLRRVPPRDFVEWRDENSVFESLAGFERGRNELAHTERAETIEVGYVSPAFFPLFRVRPAMGRTFVAEEETPGRAAVAVISHEFWRSHFGSDPEVIGKDVELSNNLKMRVVGVQPAGVRLPDKAIPIWTPLPIEPGAVSGREPSLEVYARLRPEATIEAASIELETIAARLEQIYPETNSGVGVTLVSLLEQRVGRARATLVVFLGAIVSVLLIGVLNLVHLQMARGARREREMSIRAALGAHRGRLLGQLLTEAMLLALAGGAAGLLLSVWSMDALLAHLPYSIPRQADIGIDRTVLLVSFLMSAGAGVAVGLIPGFRVSRSDLHQALKGRTSSWARHSWQRDGLVVLETALALILLMGAGLLTHSFWLLRSVDPGFDPQGLVTARVQLPETYSERSQQTLFYNQAADRLEALKGTDLAAVTAGLPLERTALTPVTAEGQSGAVTRTVSFRGVSPSYFETMGIGLVSGQTLGEGPEGGVLVGELLARRLWPGENPIGKRIKRGNRESSAPWLTVVGVASDVRQQGLQYELLSDLYLPLELDVGKSMVVAVRTNLSTEVAGRALGSVIEFLEPKATFQIHDMRAIIDGTIAPQRFQTMVLVSFSVAGILLAMIGIYGVISYTTTGRTHEIGVRMALGARRGQILALVLRQGVPPALVGIIIGLSASVGLSHLLTSLMFGITANDPPTYVTVLAVAAVVIFLACYLPSRRAMDVNPMEILRDE